MSNQPSASSPVRIEKDSMGELAVPEHALWGAQTQRAVNNFPISRIHMPRMFICALGLIKASAAKANAELGVLDPTIAGEIVKAAERVAEGHHDDQFPIDVFQTGSGTSSNMNANEVIAHLANQSAPELGVHANDHVNMSQSSNDVIPTAIHVSAALAIAEQLEPALKHLQEVLLVRAEELESVVKTGRTHLMDAMPVTMGQELGGWVHQVEEDMARFRDTAQRLYRVAQGGTAVGTGINAPDGFAVNFAKHLSKKTHLDFSPSDNFFSRIGSQDTAVELSGQLRTTAVSLAKMANDLRWMNSGPLAGLGEISLPALQPGSSIMPGKINPVIPEAVTMVSAQVIGNDATIAVAAQSGNFQLNVMLPVIAYNLLQSVELLANVSRLLADQCIAGFAVNHDNIDKALARNPILVTALNPVIGYEKGAEIAKRAYAEGRPILDVALEMTDLDEAALTALLDPSALALGGVKKPA